VITCSACPAVMTRHDYDSWWVTYRGYLSGSHDQPIRLDERYYCPACAKARGLDRPHECLPEEGWRRRQ
jgi:hypothetical protein